MTEKWPDYLSYLLRLWREGDEEKQVWRASLDSGLNGERYGFASLDDLFDFLRRSTSRRSVRFVIHLQAECAEQLPAIWRGEVEHVQSDQRWAFSALDELLEYLHQQTKDSYRR